MQTIDHTAALPRVACSASRRARGVSGNAAKGVACPPSRANARTQGFSLLELAIVIAIIGILLGGVMATNSFLTAAKQRTLINEGKLQLNAFKQFEQKYGGAKPGDMGNATSYWAASAACPTVGATGTTCNGDGNGSIASGGIVREYFLTFNHLALAGLIAGNYTGNAGPNNASHGILGTNLPAFSMEGVGGYFSAPSVTGDVSGNAAYYDGFYGTPLYLAASSVNAMPQGGFLNAATMQRIDDKFDDGRANSGWIRPFKHFTTCVSGTDYLVSNKTLGCNIIMLNP